MHSLVLVLGTDVQAVVHYVMDYPLGKKLKKILDFYVCNLRYETDPVCRVIM